MNLLKKGPQLKLPRKMPNPKVPAVLSDLYLDLRDRRLLPLVAIIVIAIAAVPIALSEAGGSEETPATGAVPTPAGTPSSSLTARNVVVARSAPGLRNYHHRLGHLTAADPFQQKFASPPASESSSGEGGTEGSSETPAPSESSQAGVTTEEGETVTETHEFKYFTYTIDVRIVPVSSSGVPSKAEPSVRHGLPELTALPSRQMPALIFMEPAADGKNAVMLVNDNVRAIFGESACVAGGATCQLLALKPGLPETIVYGGNEQTFRIELLKIDLTPTDSLAKAPQGKKKPGSISNRTEDRAPSGFVAQPR